MKKAVAYERVSTDDQTKGYLNRPGYSGELFT